MNSMNNWCKIKSFVCKEMQKISAFTSKTEQA